MPHDVTLIATIATAFGLAMVFGLLAARLKLPPLVGYLLAGIVVSPATPGFVADVGLAGQLAEIGVMLLMFGVGLHFSLADLMSVKMVEIARTLNPGIAVVLRTHNEEEADLLRKESLGTVFLGEHELARGMTSHILDRLQEAAPAREAA